MHKVIKSFEFDAAHRLHEYNGLCANIHGHRYKVEFEFMCPALDGLGIGVDFGCIKSIAKTWVDENWDHALLLNSNDPFYDLISSQVTPEGFDDMRLYPFMDINPTAEAMAKELFDVLNPLFEGETPALLSKVRVWETPTGYSEYSR